jgi:hypothetical protein
MGGAQAVDAIDQNEARSPSFRDGRWHQLESTGSLPYDGFEGLDPVIQEHLGDVGRPGVAADLGVPGQRHESRRCHRFETDRRAAVLVCGAAYETGDDLSADLGSYEISKSERITRSAAPQPIGRPNHVRSRS